MPSSEDNSQPLSKLQIGIIRCVAAPGGSTVADITKRIKSRRLPVKDVRSSLNRLTARGYLAKQGSPVEYYETETGRAAIEAAR